MMTGHPLGRRGRPNRKYRAEMPHLRYCMKKKLKVFIGSRSAPMIFPLRNNERNQPSRTWNNTSLRESYRFRCGPHGISPIHPLAGRDGVANRGRREVAHALFRTMKGIPFRSRRPQGSPGPVRSPHNGRHEPSPTGSTQCLPYGIQHGFHPSTDLHRGLERLLLDVDFDPQQFLVFLSKPHHLFNLF